MSMLPGFFGDKWFDDFFDFPVEREMTRALPPMRKSSFLMKTDVLEDDNGYELQIDLPGFHKEDLEIVSDKGYLTITASQKKETENEENGRYIRRERYAGSCSRSFYIGEEVKAEEIAAKFEDGILKLNIPKVIEKPIENRKLIPVM